ncbi:hypothetical protein EBBID32_33420 [Sphingobium indicum BiD32]|uniref:Uncharacterized protein n=1 Tax=Sphingobium indicum BiD32 TaxID=1301087 RepID=N1MQG0_9SPHN|nr:hypothetical protein EBBID32_33420 [Sphingobium indicum BiD32]
MVMTAVAPFVVAPGDLQAVPPAAASRDSIAPDTSNPRTR